MKHISCLALAMIILSQAGTAAEQSRNVYYPVKGRTAADIYNNIRTSSPRVERGATFAFTRIATKTDSKVKQAGGTCRYASFKTSAIYMFNLPQHVSPGDMASGVRTKWQNFVQYLLVHEQGHRDMWRQCFIDYDTAALNLKAPSCQELDQQREELFTSIKKRCVGQDEAFDVIFRKEVRKEPFVKEALKKGKK